MGSSALSGGSAHTQAWVLRRCLTIFNTIIGRPHRPREPNIRWMLDRLKVELPGSADDDDEIYFEEEAEEELPTDDEECLRPIPMHVCI